MIYKKIFIQVIAISLITLPFIREPFSSPSKFSLFVTFYFWSFRSSRNSLYIYGLVAAYINYKRADCTYSSFKQHIKVSSNW